jgi:hypothetical protein
MPSPEELRRVDFVRTDVSEELSTSISRVTFCDIADSSDYGGAKFLRNVGYYKSHTM